MLISSSTNVGLLGFSIVLEKEKLTDTGFLDFSGIWIDSDLIFDWIFGHFRLMLKSTSINF